LSLKMKGKLLQLQIQNFFSVENALIRLKQILKDTNDWKNLLDFIPKNIKNELENKSALASHFVASLELAKEGDVNIRQDSFKDEILLSSKNINN